MNTSDWPEHRLGDFVRIKHGFPFSGMRDDGSPDEPIVVGIGNFDYSGGFRFDTTKKKRLQGDYPSEYELSPGDVLLAMTCQTSGGEILGVPGRIPADGSTYLHNQRLGLVQVIDPHKLDVGYMFQLARWPEFNRHLFATASGSKILHTSPSRIEDFRFRVPPLGEQQAIAETLNALDDKLASNQRAIRLQRDLAIAVLSRSVIDGVRLGDVASIRKGLSYKGSGLAVKGDGLPMVNMGSAANFGWLKREGFKYYTGDFKPKHLAEPGSLIITGVEQTWKHEIIGWPLLVPDDMGQVLFTHHMLLVDFNEDCEWMRLPLWAYLYSPSARATVESLVYGTTVATLPVTGLESLRFKVPDRRSKSLAAAESLLRRCWALERESEKLTGLRDALLPELLSGRLRIPEAATVT